MVDAHADDTEVSTDDASLERLRRFGGVKLLTQMVAIFVDVAPARLAAARGAVDTNDHSAVEMAMHSLKSSCAQLGAMRMRRLCEQGETEARAGSLVNAPAILNDLDAELPRIIAWLEQAVQEKS